MSDDKTLEQLRELDLNVEPIPVGLIDPDPDNPNTVPDELMEALRIEIRERGFVQPILVRREGERYRLIDGEHRWRIISEEGYATIPAVVTDDEGDDAKIRLLTMNRLRGTLVPVRVAYVLADLAQRIPEADLRRRLGMESSEYRDTLRLADFDDAVSERVRETVAKEKRDAPVVLTFVCDARDAAAIRRVVDPMTDEKVTSGKALATVCRAYEKHEKAARAAG